jgi:hypothetical protein
MKTLRGWKEAATRFVAERKYWIALCIFLSAVPAGLAIITNPNHVEAREIVPVLGTILTLPWWVLPLVGGLHGLLIAGTLRLEATEFKSAVVCGLGSAILIFSLFLARGVFLGTEHYHLALAGFGGCLIGVLYYLEPVSGRGTLLGLLAPLGFGVANNHYLFPLLTLEATVVTAVLIGFFIAWVAENLINRFFSKVANTFSEVAGSLSKLAGVFPKSE